MRKFFIAFAQSGREGRAHGALFSSSCLHAAVLLQVYVC
jgi:hypothetical protein